MTFGGAYVFSMVAAAALGAAEESPRTSYAPLYAPLIGPFLTIRSAQSQDFATRVLIVDGIAQSAGLAMAIAGLTSHTTRLLRRVEALHVTPIAAPHFTGFGMNGTF